jgi:hypothetical protein
MTGAPNPVRDDGRMAITCPRCGSSVEVRWYGPCEDCRAVLRSTLRNEARAVEREAFEPAMHVTPNAVALKDD